MLKIRVILLLLFFSFFMQGVMGVYDTIDITAQYGIPPVVVTDDILEVGSDYATVQGLLMSMGSASSVLCYFEYGTDTSLNRETNYVIMNNSAFFSITITGLQPDMKYYYRAVAEGHGFSYGVIYCFTTKSGGAVSSISPSTAVSFRNRLSLLVVFEGLPVIGAQVMILKNGQVIKQGLTDEKGRVCFSLKDGEYTVKVVAIGYNEYTEEIRVIKSMTRVVYLEKPFPWIAVLSTGSMIIAIPIIRRLIR